MAFLEFNDLSFAYPPVEGDLDENGKQIIPRPVFDHFTAELPSGFVNFIGPNGCGKTTLLMLASGRLAPTNGSVSLLGQNPYLLGQEAKNLLASVIYQNMEFESGDSVKALLNEVYESGNLKGRAAGIRDKNSDLLEEVISIFELEKLLSHGLTKLSKGEMQRVLLAFSILYGSPSIFMDEPMFAMEDRQKESSLAYLRDFVHKTGTTIYVSLHEIDLSRKYADQVLLFYPNRDMSLGSPEEVLTNEDLEKAYGVPAAMLKSKEDLTRQQLKDVSDLIKKKLRPGSGRE